MSDMPRRKPLTLAARLPLAVAILVFAIWSLILLIRYRRIANEAALDAEQTWARDL